MNLLERNQRMLEQDEIMNRRVLENSLDNLKKVTDQLRRYSIIIAIIELLLMVIGLIILGFNYSYFGHDKYNVIDNYFVFFYLFALIGISSLVVFEKKKRRGEILFEEISDELHWDIGYQRTSKNNVIANERPNLEIRLILRDFAKSSNLPFLPNRYATTAYAIFTIVLVFLISILGFKQ